MPPAQAGKPGSGLPGAEGEIHPLQDSPGITCPAVLRGNGGEGWHSRHHPPVKHLCPAPAAPGIPQDQALPWLTDWWGPGSIPYRGAGWGQGWGTHGPPQPRGFFLAFCQV